MFLFGVEPFWRFIWTEPIFKRNLFSWDDIFKADCTSYSLRIAQLLILYQSFYLHLMLLHVGMVCVSTGASCIQNLVSDEVEKLLDNSLMAWMFKPMQFLHLMLRRHISPNYVKNPFITYRYGSRFWCALGATVKLIETVSEISVVFLHIISLRQ